MESVGLEPLDIPEEHFDKMISEFYQDHKVEVDLILNWDSAGQGTPREPTFERPLSSTTFSQVVKRVYHKRNHVSMPTSRRGIRKKTNRVKVVNKAGYAKGYEKMLKKIGPKKIKHTAST